jgi:hypothetical protein
MIALPLQYPSFCRGLIYTAYDFASFAISFLHDRVFLTFPTLRITLGVN